MRLMSADGEPTPEFWQLRNQIYFRESRKASDRWFASMIDPDRSVRERGLVEFQENTRSRASNANVLAREILKRRRKSKRRKVRHKPK